MTEWRKSSYSNTGGQCVEMRDRSGEVDMRDSVHPSDGYLTFAAAEWRSFLRDLRRERF
ncbi:DUF397 domain-containing protein [Nocardiopsis rhodophaea]|uniref:DUF397 domain-containing protein n=1 Tax=Nocardiopsis rhodophaea TaxID=280238 RepID=UPI0031D9ABA5